jgi:DNA-binding NtrC family response regulator
MKVGSSNVIKTDVRVVAASNVNIPKAIEQGTFREDLFYRLNNVPLFVPPLRDRKDDIHLLFRKFAADFAEKYRMPPLRLTPDAIRVLSNYYWPGNVRQLKNVTEQVSIMEKEKEVDATTLKNYLPGVSSPDLPVLFKKEEEEHFSDRELLYKFLFDMKKDLTELKKVVVGIMEKDDSKFDSEQTKSLLIKDINDEIEQVQHKIHDVEITPELHKSDEQFHPSEVIEESLSLAAKEREMIEKALEKHRGKRKNASKELGISERTLYRKIKEYNIRN